MFKANLLGLITSLLVVFASSANANPLVYGKWISTQEQDDLTFTLALTIEKRHSTLSVTCADGNRWTKVTVTVPTEVTANQLLVKGSASAEKRLGDINCLVEIVPMELDYRMEGRHTLHLTAQGQTAIFDRVK